MSPILITRKLRVYLTISETVDAAKASAELTKIIKGLEEEKSRVSKDYGCRIGEATAQRQVLNNAISEGYELRNVECTVLMHVPKTGLKTITRTDTRELVGVENMTQEELQEKLDFNSDTKKEQN